MALDKSVVKRIAELTKLRSESEPYKSDFVPDNQCKQGKCANATTGCHGHCRLHEMYPFLQQAEGKVLVDAELILRQADYTSEVTNSKGELKTIHHYVTQETREAIYKAMLLTKEK